MQRPENMAMIADLKQPEGPQLSLVKMPNIVSVAMMQDKKALPRVCADPLTIAECREIKAWVD